MKTITCDQCGENNVGNHPRVQLSGVDALSKTILLPDEFHEKHFCSTKCFWDWAISELKTFWNISPK